MTPPHNAKLWKRGVASPGRLIPSRGRHLLLEGAIGEASPYVKFFLRGLISSPFLFFDNLHFKTDYYGRLTKARPTQYRPSKMFTTAFTTSCPKPAAWYQVYKSGCSGPPFCKTWLKRWMPPLSADAADVVELVFYRRTAVCRKVSPRPGLKAFERQRSGVILDGFHVRFIHIVQLLHVRCSDNAGALRFDGVLRQLKGQRQHPRYGQVRLF